MLNHSVSSTFSPLEEVYERFTAKEKRVNGVPSAVTCISGSLPRFPMSMILLSMNQCLPFTLEPKKSSAFSSLHSFGLSKNRKGRTSICYERHLRTKRDSRAD